MCRNWYEFGLDLASGSQSPSFLLKVLPFEKPLEQCLAQRKCSLSVFFFYFLVTPRGMWDLCSQPGIEPVPPVLDH